MAEKGVEDKTICGEEKFTLSERGQTKIQGCAVDGIGKVIFINDRAKAIAGVSAANIPKAREMVNQTKAEITVDYPLEG